MYINPNTLSNQRNPAPGLLPLTTEQEQIYLQCNGFVKLTIEEVAVPVPGSSNEYTVQKRVTNLEPDIEKWEAWKANELIRPDSAPRGFEQLRADIDYIALMMGVEL